MSGSGQDDTTPSGTDGDGVRIIRERSPARRSQVFGLLALAMVGIAIGYFAWWSPLSQRVASKPEAAGSTAVPAAEVHAARVVATDGQPTMNPTPAAPPPATAQSNPADWRTGDANDIATYVSPTDPEPTAAELIQALRDSGERGGIAAFNPPGTSPPLVGLAVPEDFALPPGYVRHHQVTDAGEPIEAILMFSPDHVFRDAAGNVIPIPEDRVVPPEMAPPGLPIREIEIPPPPQ
jgi:hypothetical protein